MSRGLGGLLSLAAIGGWLLAANPAMGADLKAQSAQKEQELIAILKSDAKPGDKAVACKHLAVYGSDQAVPVLAPLLADEQMASWARIALEAIPGAAADEALRQAAGKLQGRLLQGVINTIGLRRDPQAVEQLAGRLKDSDPEIVGAAAVALGRIGGFQAANALQGVIAQAPQQARAAVAEGCVRCAERFLTDGKQADAVKLYDLVRKAEVPKQQKLDATRGAILARQAEGIPLLLEQLRSADKDMLAIGLSTARELPGTAVTEALAGEIKKAPPQRQPLLLLALADRNDPAALPTIMEAARTGSKTMKLTAIGVLDRQGNASSLPTLLELAAGNDAELAQAAMNAMVRLPAKEVDAEVLARLGKASGKTRAALVDLAGQRSITAALPAIAQSVQDPDPKTRSLALKSLGTLGSEQQVSDLVKLLPKVTAPTDRDEIESALLAISSRRGSACAPQLLPLTRQNDAGLRIIGLHTLASAGGPAALAAVKSALDDKDEAVQDEAVRTLSTWPNTWPEDTAVAEPLLNVAKSDKKLTHQVLAARGYLQYLQSNRKLNDQERVDKTRELLPLLKRTEEKQMAIGLVSGIPTAGALALLSTLAAEPAVADDACAALVQLAGKDLPGVAKDQRQQALQLVIDKCANEKIKKRAQEVMAKLR